MSLKNLLSSSIVTHTHRHVQHTKNWNKTDHGEQKTTLNTISIQSIHSFFTYFYVIFVYLHILHTKFTFKFINIHTSFQVQ